eukprot:scaffold1140_cov251-Pinguiococcus_pyrenoidosus.AAC.14
MCAKPSEALLHIFPGVPTRATGSPANCTSFNGCGVLLAAPDVQREYPRAFTFGFLQSKACVKWSRRGRSLTEVLPSTAVTAASEGKKDSTAESQLKSAGGRRPTFLHADSTPQQNTRLWRDRSCGSCIRRCGRFGCRIQMILDNVEQTCEDLAGAFQIGAEGVPLELHTNQCALLARFPASFRPRRHFNPDLAARAARARVPRQRD